MLLSGANTFNGGINLTAGQLDINSAAALGTGTFNISAGTTIDSTAAAETESNNNAQFWGGSFTYIGTFALNIGSGAVTLGANTTVTTNTSGIALTSAAVGDSGNNYSLTKAGPGTLALAAAGTFGGGTSIGAGLLSFANGGLGSGNIAFTASSTLQWYGTNTQDISSKLQAIPSGVVATLDTVLNSVTLASTVSGAGSLKKVGAGTLTLSGANSFNGGVNLSAGQLLVNSTTAIGTGTLTISGGAIGSTSAITLTTNNPMVWAANFNFSGTTTLNMGTGAVTLAVTPTITSTSTTGNWIIGGVISGAFGITKAGASGIVTLLGADSYSGTTNLSAGQLNIDNPAALGTGTFLVGSGKFDNTTGSALTLSNNNVMTWFGSPTFVGTSPLNLGSGAVTLTASITVTTSTTGIALIEPGVISGAFILTKAGNGTMLLSGNNALSSGIKLTAGILDINSAGALGTGTFNVSAGTIDNTSGSLITLSNPVALAGTLTFAGTNNLSFGTGAVTLITASRSITVTAGTLTFGGAIGDGGSSYKITAAGAGTLVLSGTNTFGGGVAISTGTLDINNAKAIGTGTLTISSGTIDNTSGSPITLANNNAQSWTGTFIFRDTNNLNLGAGAVTLAGTTAINISGGILTVGGVISGAHTLTKTGAGTLLVTGANTYTLGTTVSAGTLVVNNTTGSATGTGAVTVSNGATLAGTGVVGGAVTVSSGGTLSPGYGGPSTFGTGNLVLSSGSNLNILINGNSAGSGYSQVNATGTASVTGSNLILSGTRTGHDGTVLNLMNVSSASAITGTFAGLAQGAATSAVNSIVYNVSYIGGTGNDLTLTAATAPTSIVIASGTNPTIYNQSVTFTATVTSSATGTPTGNVTFLQGSTTLGTAALNGSAVATLSFSTLPVGSDAITAMYVGDTSFSPSTSSTLTQTVTAGPPANLAFTQQPSTVGVGNADSPAITVAVEDQYGNIVLTDSSSVTLAVASGPGVVGGTLTATAVGGLASFNNVAFVTTGVYNLIASDGALASATSNNFTVTAGPPQLVWIQPPSDVTAGNADSPSIVLQIEDQFGNVITTDNSNVTLSVAIGPLGATGTFTVAAFSGVATFSNVFLTTAGTYTLTAMDGTIPSSTSNSFAVSFAAASQLAYAQQPGNVAAGASDSPAIVVDVEDPYGNIVTTDNSTVTISVATGPGVASGTLSVAAVNGVANFADVELDNAGNYTLSAADGSLTPAASGSLTVTAATASQLVLTQQPGNLVAGVVESPSIIVDVEDPFGNVVTTDSSSVTLSTSSGPGSLGGTEIATAVNGVATFSNILLDTAGDYTVAATDGSLAPAYSNSFTVTPGLTSQVAFVPQPGTAIVNASCPVIIVDVEDQFGNLISSDSSMVTLAVASGPGNVSGTLTAAAFSGVATFNDIALSAVGTYTVIASDGSLSSATSASFAVTPAAAAQVVFTQPPANATAGVANSPSIVVNVEDQYGNVETTDGSTVTLSTSTGPGNPSGTVAVTSVNGVATFSNLILNTAGNYTLTASDSSLMSATSGGFTITPASASQLVYAQQPGNATAGVAIAPAITVDVEDAFGNLISTDSSTVTLAIASGPGAPTGTLTSLVAGGVATFNNVILDTAGAYSLTANDGALTTATSNSCIVAPAAASQLVFVQQPSGAIAGVADAPTITVNVEDRFNNIVTTDDSTVTLGVASGPGIAGGTLTVAAENGMATFGNVIFSTAGSYTLTGSDGALSQVISNSFTVSPAASSQLAFAQQPGNVIAGVANGPAIVVDIEDSFGNIAIADNSIVTIAVASGSGTAMGTLAVAAVNGVATFNNVVLNTAGVYTLGASDGALTSAISRNFTVSSAVASQLIYARQPSNVTAGVAISPSVILDVADQFGNLVTTSNASVTLSVATGPGVAVGTLTASASGGVATFANVELNTAGIYTLTASGNGLTSANSSSIAVVAAAATQLVYARQPRNTIAGVANSPSIVVDVEDCFGNIAGADSSTVTLAVSTGPGAVSGVVTAAALNGIATFNNVRLNTAGNYTLTAADGTLISAVSTSFSIIAAAASTLSFAQQPSNAIAGVPDSPSITVDVEDGFGNIVATDSSVVTLAAATGPGSAGGTLSAIAVNGVATFNNVRVITAGTYMLTAADGSLTAANSSNFTVVASAASQVVFARQPGDATAGIADSTSIVVDVEDQFGNLATADISPVTLAVAIGPGNASGTLNVSAVNGVATFANVMFDTAGTYTVSAGDGSLTPATSVSFAVEASSAAKLVYVQQPANVSAGATINPSITVEVEDAFGNRVTNDDSAISLNVAAGPGAAGGTLTSSAISGEAAFSNVILDTAGTYTLAASDGSITPATSSSLTVTAAAASQVVFSQEPGDVIAGVANSPSIVADIEDPFGNLVTNNTSTVTVSVASGPGAATGTLTAVASAGHATFDNVLLNTAGGYTLNAVDGSLTSATSSGFQVTPGAASQLVYAQQPAGVVAGVSDSPAIRVDVEDQFGNLVVSNESTVTLATATGPASAGGTLASVAVNGVATFNDVQLETEGSYTLTAADGSLVSATSASFNVSAAAASQLLFIQQPSNAIAGATQASSIVVDVEDQFHNLVVTENSILALTTATGPGSPSGTLMIAAINGIATFDNVEFDIAGNYTLNVADSGLSGAQSNSFAIRPATAAALGFLVEPSNAKTGIADSPALSVDVKDPFGNIVDTGNSAVTIAVATGPAGASGTLTANCVNGIATFGNVILDTVGNYTLTAIDGNLASATSNGFVVTPSASTSLQFVQQPTEVIAGQSETPSIVVDVIDQFGNLVPNDNSTVTLVVSAGRGDASGTLSSPAVNGVATFNSVRFDTTGNYTLTAADGMLNSAISSSFAVVPAPAALLVFAQGPGDVTAGAADSPSIVLDVDDQFGNIVTTDGSTVTVAVFSGPGSASGTLSAAVVNGVAALSDVIFDTAGSYTLSASDGVLTGATSASFTVSPSIASQLSYVQQPNDVSAGASESPAIRVDVEDQFGNVVTTDSSTVTIAVAAGPGAADGNLSVAAVNGVAGFSSVEFDIAGNYTLSASDSGLTPAVSSAFAVGAAAASQLVYIQPPTNSVAGTAVNPSIVVNVLDRFGNVVTSDSSSVTVAVTTGPGDVSGTSTLNASGGIATFHDVELDTVGTYTLSVEDGTLSAAISGLITITHAAATRLAFIQQPEDSVAGTELAASIAVDVEDRFGNIITTDNSTISLAVATGPGSVGGNLIASALSGTATFDDVVLDTAGDYTLTASDAELLSATSSLFAVRPAAASQLVYAHQPSNASAGSPNSPVILVDVEDQYGNVVTNDNSTVTLSVATGPGTAGGSLSVSAADGVASFTDVRFDTPGSYTLISKDAALSAATSDGFTVIPSAPAQLAFVHPPGDVLAGVIEMPSILVDVDDQFGNLVTSDDSTVTLGVFDGPDSATVGGTFTTTAVNGVATFNKILFDTSGSYTLIARDGSVTPAISSEFTVSPDPTSTVLTASVDRSVFGQTVSLSATIENSVAGGLPATGNVTFMDGSVTVGTSALDSSGTAVFSTSYFAVGRHPITAVYSGDVDFLASVSSASILLVSRDSTITSIVTSPNSAVFSQPVTFTATVAPSLPGSGVPTGNVNFVDGSTILSTVSLDSNGVATLTTSTLLVGDHPISAVYGGDTNYISGTSATVSMPVVQTAAKLIVVRQPGSVVAGQSLGSLQVEVEDALGNVVAGDSSLIMASGDSALSGTTSVNAENGVATFTDLSISLAGEHTLTFTDGSLLPALSVPFTVVPADAVRLFISGQPADSAFAGSSIGTVAVEALDAFGNLVTADNSVVTLSGGSNLSGTTVESIRGGVATFSDVSLTSAGSYVLTATDGNLIAATSNSIAVNPTYAATAGSWVAPIAIDADSLFPQSAGRLRQVNVKIESQSSGGATVVNALVNLRRGKATLSKLKLLKAGTYTLTISDRQGHTATQQIVIAAGTPAKLMFTSQPARVDGSEAITVAVLDRFGNLCSSNNSVAVTLQLARGSFRGPQPELIGQTTAVVAAGLATFADLSVNHLGLGKIVATARGLMSVTSHAFKNG